MGTIPKPKRTVTIQLGPHVAVGESFGIKEPPTVWEKEPNLKLSSASRAPKEQRQDSVCANMGMANRDRHGRQPIKADRSASASAGHRGNMDSEGLIGQDQVQTGALINQGEGNSTALIGQGAGNARALVGQGASDSRALIGQGVSDLATLIGQGGGFSGALISQGAGDSAALIGQGVSNSAALIRQGAGDSRAPIGQHVGHSEALIGQGVGDLRVSSRKDCQAEPSIPTQDGFRACDGSYKSQGFEERSADPTAERLRSQTSEGSQKSGGSIHTMHEAQTTKPEVHQENPEKLGNDSPLRLSHGLSGCPVTSITPLNLKLTGMEGLNEGLSGGTVTTTTHTEGLSEGLSGGTVTTTTHTEGLSEGLSGGTVTTTTHTEGLSEGLSGGTVTTTTHTEGLSEGLSGRTVTTTTHTEGLSEGLSGGTVTTTTHTEGLSEGLSGGTVTTTTHTEGLSEGLSGGTVTNATLLNTALIDSLGMFSLACPTRGKLGAQRDSDRSSHPQKSALLLRDFLGGQKRMDCAQVTEGGPQSTGEETQEVQLVLNEVCLRFQNTASMTASPERSSCSGATWQDVEVQAVPEVCSRSAGTSPAHFTLATPPPLGCLLAGESSGPTGASPVHAGSRPAKCSPPAEALPKEGGASSDACTQTLVSSQACAGLSPPAGGQVRAPVSPGSGGKSAGASHHSGSTGNHDMELGARPKEPGLHLSLVQKGPLQPGHQVNTGACSQSNNVSSSSVHEGEPSKAHRPCLSQSTDGSHACSLQDKPTASNHACHSVSDVISFLDQSVSNPMALACSSALSSRLQVKTRAVPGAQGHPVELLVVEACTEHKKDVPCEVRSELGLEQNRSKPHRDEGDPGAAVPEVVWDEQGMTWEVYGASVDPESLGFAIQSHLLCKIKEHERHIETQPSCMRKATLAEPPPDRAASRTRKRPRHVMRSLLQNILRPACCSRKSASVPE